MFFYKKLQNFVSISVILFSLSLFLIPFLIQDEDLSLKFFIIWYVSLIALNAFLFFLTFTGYYANQLGRRQVLMAIFSHTFYLGFLLLLFTIPLDWEVLF